MLRDPKTLDFSLDIDVLYAYQNAIACISEFDHIPNLKDMDYALIIQCLGSIEASVLNELNEFHVDDEISYLLDKTIFSNSIQNSTPVNQKFYINNLNVLLRPLLHCLNKPIVDLLFFVYRKTGVCHFGIMFDEFKNSPDLLIELHLIIARGLKEKSFNLLDIKSCLDSIIESDQLVSPETFDIKQTSEQVKFESLNDINEVNEKDMKNKLEFFKLKESISIGGFEENKHQKNGTYSSKTNKSHPIGSLSSHLNKAKELLLSMPEEETKFILDNASTYLTIKFDNEILDLFLKHSNDQSFYIYLNKFKNPPYFLYSNCAIYNCLVNIRRFKAQNENFLFSSTSLKMPIKGIGLQNHENLSQQTLDSNIAANLSKDSIPICTFADTEELNVLKMDVLKPPIENSIENQKPSICDSSISSFKPFVNNESNDKSKDTYSLYKHHIVCNAFTLKHYLKFVFSLINSSGNPSESYYSAYDGFFYFLKKYKHPSFFYVLQEFLNSKYERFVSDAQFQLFRNLDLLFEVFYKDYTFSKPSCESLEKTWTNWNNALNEPFSYTGNFKEIAGAFHSPEKYDEVEQKASEYILNIFPFLFKSKSLIISTNSEEDIKLESMQFLDNFLIESSKNPILKGYLIEKIHIIRYLKEDLKTKILENLKDFNGVCWRYKKSFIKMNQILENYGINKSWIINELQNDKVWFIRQMVKDLR